MMKAENERTVPYMKLTKKAFSALLLCALCLPLCVGCSPEKPTGTSSETPSDPTSEPTPVDPSQLDDDAYFAQMKPVLRFALASDVHIGDSGSSKEESRLAELFEMAYAYADADEDYKRLDALLLAGDLSNAGTLSSMKKVRSIVDRNIREETKRLFVLGNHDYFTNAKKAEDYFREAFGSEPFFHQVIGGYHFIGISPSNGGNHFDTAAITYLKTELAAASADTPDKPIFVLQHQHVSNTVCGSTRWGVTDLSQILRKYPQVIDLSGHSHFPIEDPRSVWQGQFTALGTGTLSYFECSLTDVAVDTLFASGREGDYTTSTQSRDGAEFFIVEVDAAGAVEAVGYDILSHTEVCRYRFRTPTDKSSFTYTNARKNTAPLPELPEAEVQVDDVTNSGAVLRFPRAMVKEGVVGSYRAEVSDPDGNVKKFYALSCYFYHPIPENVRILLSGLSGETDYTVKVYAVNAFGVSSEEFLTASFRTAKDPEPEMPEGPDVFSARFDENGAYDALSGVRLDVCGKPQTKQNEDGGYVGVFDGSSGYKFMQFSQFYRKMATSVSFETYVKPEAFSDKSYTDFVSNQQGAGFGLELSKNGMLEIYAHIGGDYRITGAKIPFGEYLHVVGTYDGNALVLYVNGKKVSELAYKGKITFPSSPSNYLGVGADSCPSGSAEAGMKGEIAVANVYGVALTPAQVAGLYQQYER